MRRIYVADGNGIKETSGIAGLKDFADFALPQTETGFGAALDLGTTTLAAALVDLSTGKTVKTASEANMQGCGDVISRIDLCREKGVSAIQKITAEQINGILSALTSERIKRLTVAGNTVMLHILAGADPSSLGEYPYSPQFIGTKVFLGNELNINADEITLLPSASGYIGADVVGGLSYLSFRGFTPPYLLLDLGTNGEIALVTGDGIYCASTAIGPAFEGGCTECGVPAIGGAIDSVRFSDGRLEYTTIGGEEAVGLCGSGVLDLVAALLKSGKLDRTGAFTEDAYSGSGRVNVCRNVYFTQKDVRQFQLAKSAVYTGISMLLSYASVKSEEITAVCLAGGAGVSISPESALCTGLIPTGFRGKAVSVGNSALAGAKLALLTGTSVSESTAKRCHVLELASSPTFEKEYLNNLNF